MQALAALVLLSALATSSPPAHQDVPSASAEATAGAYLAELHADWHLTRETRVACPAEAGCAIDLALAHEGLAAVHVRFEPLRAGLIVVRSRLEGRDGRASGPENKTLSLDSTGFGADHYEARMVPCSPEEPIIMMAVKVPGWTAPAAHVQQPI